MGLATGRGAGSQRLELVFMFSHCEWCLLLLLHLSRAPAPRQLLHLLPWSLLCGSWFCFLTASESSLLQTVGVPSPALGSPHDALSLYPLSSRLGLVQPIQAKCRMPGPLAGQ